MERADECRSQTAEDRDLKRSEQRADIDRDDDEHQGPHGFVVVVYRYFSFVSLKFNIIPCDNYYAKN